jgi:hypothetical protein
MIGSGAASIPILTIPRCASSGVNAHLQRNRNSRALFGGLLHHKSASAWRGCNKVQLLHLRPRSRPAQPLVQCSPWNSAPVPHWACKWTSRNTPQGSRISTFSRASARRYAGPRKRLPTRNSPRTSNTSSPDSTASKCEPKQSDTAPQTTRLREYKRHHEPDSPHSIPQRRPFLSRTA